MTKTQRARDVGTICGEIHDDLALAAWTQSEPPIGFAVFRDLGRKSLAIQTFATFDPHQMKAVEQLHACTCFHLLLKERESVCVCVCVCAWVERGGGGRCVRVREGWKHEECCSIIECVSVYKFNVLDLNARRDRAKRTRFAHQVDFTEKENVVKTVQVSEKV